MSSPLAVIQARMESTRLPGKSLVEINDRPLLEHVVRRTHRAVSDPVLAIPDTTDNDELQKWVEDWPCRVIRGAETDVLGRFYTVLEQFPEAGPILRVTGDNPLISPFLLKRTLENLGSSDWGSFRYLPHGIGAAVFRRQWLERAHHQATDPEQREHVTLWIKRHPEVEAGHWDPPQRFRAPGLRLTVDTKQDLRLIRRLGDEFGTELINAEAHQIIGLLAERPDLIEINAGVKQSVYESPPRLLFCLNRGNRWGRGHWQRSTQLTTGLHGQHIRNVQSFVLLGEVDGNNTDRCLARVRGPLTENHILRWSRRVDPRVMVLDHKESTATMVKTLQDEGASVLGLEDRGAGRSQMDAVVDPNLYEATLEQDKLPEYRRYYGPDYAMIDPAYRQYHLDQERGSVDRVGLCFGGTDPAGIGPLFIREIAPRFGDIEFHLFGTEPEIETPENVILDGFVENAPKRFSSMDFMVVSGGVLKFEVACLRMPSMILAQNQEQYENSRRFIEDNGLHWPVFPPGKDVAAWAEALFEATQPRALKASYRSTEGVVDGKGIQRVLKILTALIDNRN